MEPLANKFLYIFALSPRGNKRAIMAQSEGIKKIKDITDALNEQLSKDLNAR